MKKQVYQMTSGATPGGAPPAQKNNAFKLSLSEWE